MRAKNQSQRFYFPQDEIWNHANQIKLSLIRVEERWCLDYEVHGTIGRDPFAEVEDTEDGGCLEEEAPDAACVAQSIISSLVGQTGRAEA